MADTRDLDQLKDIGSGRSAPEAVVRLYRQAFEEFGTRALGSWRRSSTRRSRKRWQSPTR
jgi:hypothetical protein